MSQQSTRSVVTLNNVDLSNVEAEIGQAFNSVEIDPNNGNRLLFGFPDDNGTKTAVSVSGGGTAVQAYDSVSVSGNNIVFGKTDGSTADTQPLDGLTAITSLESTVGGHSIDINDFKSREQFKALTQHPDLTNSQMDVNNPTVNGLTYVFSDSSTMHALYVGRYAFHQSRSVGWVSAASANHEYDNAVGSNYDYSGTESLGGISGEWLQIQLPQAVIMSSFSMAADGTHGIPKSFKVVGSTDGTNYDILGEYTDVSVATTDEGSNFKLNTSLAAYGNAYTYYAIVVTRATRAGAGTNKNVGLRHLRYFSVSKDVSDTIATATTSFYDATITGTNTLNLISNSGTTSLTLPGGTTTATSVDALTFNFTVQTVSGSDYYFLNGMKGSTAPLELLFMHKYIFTFPSSHPLKLSRTPDGTHAGGTEWTTGVTVDSSTQITGMGGTIIEENGYNNITEIDYNTTTTIPQLEVTRAHGNVITHLDHIPLSDSFVSAQKDGDNIKLTTISGAQTSVGPFSGGGGTAASSTTNYPTSAMTSNGGFSGTPPTTISLGGTWVGASAFTLPATYVKNTSDDSYTFVRYDLTAANGNIVGANYGIAFYLDTNNNLILDANWSAGGSATPNNVKVNGGALVSSSVVQVGDAIEIPLDFGSGLVLNATCTVPTEFAASAITTSGSTEYNLFTDKLFGSDNLGNIGTFGSTNLTIQQWAYDATDGNVVVMAHEGSVNTLFLKMTLTGVAVTGIGGTAANTGKYVTGIHTYTSAADLITAYNGATHSTHTTAYTFTKHSLFDLAVNNSPAYHAFDEDATSEWVSHSNTYDVTTGDALQPGFSGTPPVNINLTAGSWLSNGWNYVRTTYTDNYALYDLSVGTGYGIVFSMSNNQLTLDVNDATHGNPGIPASFTINGTTASNPGIVAPNDTINLLNTAGGLEAQFTVPSELAVVGSKLASTTDAGEFLKIDLGSAITAETLTLKSVAEYKEPRINMTGYSQCGYEVTASSEHTGREVYLAFNSLTHVAVFGGDGWYTAANTFAGGNHNTSANLGTDTTGGSTINGEYAILNLPDKRKLNSYLIARQDGYTNGFPKDWKVYGRQTMTSNWELIDERTGEAPASYISGSVDTGGSVYSAATTTKYQSFALVVSKIDMTGTTTRNNVRVAEIKFNCQPSEIEEFKLYGSPDNSSWTEIHAQTSANITSSGTEFSITNPGSYQHYGLVVTKNGLYHNVSLAEMKLGVSDTVDLSNYYNKTELEPLICKAKASYTHTGGTLGTGTLSNDVGIAPSPSVGTVIGNSGSPWDITAAHYSLYPITFSFTTARTNANYQVLVSEAANGQSNYNIIMSSSVRNKTNTGFLVSVLVYEASSSGNLNWGIDFVVF